MRPAAGNRLIRRAVMVALPAIAGLAAYAVWQHDEPASAIAPAAVPADPAPARPARPAPPDTGAPAGQPALPADVSPGSMQATLFATNERNRGHILRLAIVDGGHTCTEVVSAAAVGATARVWRARCAGGDIYWVSVDAFDRLVVEPAPYGDVDPAIPNTTPVVPRTTDPRSPDLEQPR